MFGRRMELSSGNTAGAEPWAKRPEEGTMELSSGNTAGAEPWAKRPEEGTYSKREVALDTTVGRKENAEALREEVIANIVTTGVTEKFE